MGQVYDGVLGLCVGDALGVPVEFTTRAQRDADPVDEMRGYGCYNVPAGSWSDDSSMALCLLDSLAENNAVFKPEDVMQRFLSWANNGAYTPHGEMFDIGNATHQAICRFSRGTPPLECGGQGEHDNGNGSLMRILPLVFPLYSRYGADFTASPEAMETIHQVSALTHAHPRSQLACGIYLCVAAALLDGMEPVPAAACGIGRAVAFYADGHPRFAYELDQFSRLFQFGAFRQLPRDSIRSTGYVVDTLEAALWCLAVTGDYRDCVQQAVNLGEDTDTVAAVAGGLAGLYYHANGIPPEWIACLAKRPWIASMCGKLEQVLHHCKSKRQS